MRKYMQSSWHLTTTRRWVALAAAMTIMCAGCASSGDHANSSPPSLTVFAAASLTDVLPTLDARPTFQFAASNTLATQIREGAQVDVFAAANSALPNALHADKLVDAPIAFAANHIVMVIPASSRMRSVDDLVRDRSAVIVMARPGVPLGDYTTKVLNALGLSELLKRARSQEADARAVATKVALGEADAGFVYVTDVGAFHTRLHAVEFPATEANHVVYEAAVVTSSRHATAALAFIDTLTSAAGQRRLQRAGFDVLSSDKVDS